MNEAVLQFDVHVTTEEDHVRVQVAGHPTIGQLASLVHLLGVESGTWPHDLLLLDLREVQTHFTREEQFTLGQETACSLAHLRRIASLVPPERVTRVSEKAARRNGTDVRVFDSEAAALAWLRGA